MTAPEAMADVWLSTAEAAAVATVTKRHVEAACKEGRLEARQARGNGGLKYLVSLESLVQWRPECERVGIRRRWLERCTKRPPAVSGSTRNLPATVEPSINYSTAWQAFATRSEKCQNAAQLRLTALRDLDALTSTGATLAQAVAAICQRRGTSRASLLRWRSLVKDAPPEHWLPLLAPDQRGGAKQTEIHPAAWDFIKREWGSQSKPPVAAVYEQAEDEARRQGWGPLPHIRTIERMLKDLPLTVRTYLREGDEALARMYPAQERDITTLGLFDAWEADGRKHDVHCVWPDGMIARPIVVIWRDLRTKMVLGVRVGPSESTKLIRSAFLHALETAGAIPSTVTIDNGRAFASKDLSGGNRTRFRFTVKEDDPIGIFTALGITAQFATPYHGQSKPIEPFWRWLAGRVDMSSELRGAYCGPNALAKPEEFSRDKAAPIDVFVYLLLNALDWFNKRHKHRGRGMNGRTPQELVDELRPTASLRPVNQEQLDLCLLTAQAIRIDREDGSVRLMGNRYWAEPLADLDRDKTYTVRYDEYNLARPVIVQDGRGLSVRAPLLGTVGFLDAEAARNFHKQKALFKREARRLAKQETETIRDIGLQAPPMLSSQQGALLIAHKRPAPAPETAPAPEPAAGPARPPEEEAELERLRAIRRSKYGN